MMLRQVKNLRPGDVIETNEHSRFVILGTDPYSPEGLTIFSVSYYNMNFRSLSSYNNGIKFGITFYDTDYVTVLDHLKG